MIGLFITIINMSIAASIVAIAVMLMRLLLKIAPKKFSYVLWGIVFFRLICPFSFESPASLMPTNAEIIPSTITDSSIPQIHSGITALDDPVNLFFETTMPQIGPNMANPMLTILSFSSYIWLSGLTVLLLYSIAAYWRLIQRIYDATKVGDKIFESDKIPTAFVTGIVHPIIYIPSTVKGEQLGYILKHEQAHIRRRDYLIKPLAYLILIIHWFNPIIWLSYYLLSRDMEMSCDEAVLSKADNDIRQDYSTSLYNLYAPKTRLLSPLAFGEGSFRNMKERIKNVMKFKKTPRWALVFCSILLALFIMGFTTHPPVNSSDLLANLENAPIQNSDETTSFAPEFNTAKRADPVAGEYIEISEDQIPPEGIYFRVTIEGDELAKITDSTTLIIYYLYDNPPRDLQFPLMAAKVSVRERADSIGETIDVDILRYKADRIGENNPA